MVRETKYIIRRVIIGVLIALILGFLNTRKVQALSTITYQNWQFVYRDNTYGQLWDNTFIYRLGEQKSLLAVNVYFPSFQGYYNGTLTFQLDPVQFPNQPNGFLTNQYFKLFVYQNGSYLSNYSIGTCDGQWTCSFNFQGTAQQLSSNNFSVQLLINNDSFSSAYIFYPAARISATVFVSDEDNSGNQDIINNQNDNTQNIINNQNENTQQIIDSNQVCKTISSSSISIMGKYLTSSGSLSDNSQYGITDYFSVISSNLKVFQGYPDGSTANLCFYDSNKTLISCLSNGNLVANTVITIPDGSSFVRFSIRHQSGNSSLRDRPQFVLCTNGNQALNDILTDDSEPGVGQFVGDLEDIMPSNTPITDLLTLPLTLLTYYLNGFNELCTPYTLGSLYGTTLTLPCIDLEQRLGSTLWNTIDALCSLFLIYNIAMMCVQIYEAITSFEDPVSIMYQPQHGDTRVNRSREAGLYD